jgi:hypothetical protein
MRPKLVTPTEHASGRTPGRRSRIESAGSCGGAEGVGGAAVDVACAGCDDGVCWATANDGAIKQKTTISATQRRYGKGDQCVTTAKVTHFPLLLCGASRKKRRNCNGFLDTEAARH